MSKQRNKIRRHAVYRDWLQSYVLNSNTLTMLQLKTDSKYLPNRGKRNARQFKKVLQFESMEEAESK